MILRHRWQSDIDVTFAIGVAPAINVAPAIGVVPDTVGVSG
jgi:hypothetical protein